MPLLSGLMIGRQRCCTFVMLGLDPSTSTHSVAESRRVLIPGGADGGARVKPYRIHRSGKRKFGRLGQRYFLPVMARLVRANPARTLPR